MVVSLKKHRATESRDLGWCIDTYPATREHTRRLLQKISSHFSLGGACTILEIGAAQGRLVAACQSLGYSCYGLEPNDSALRTSCELSLALKVSIPIQRGFAEDIPFDDNMFDLVIANSVMEHVQDVGRALSEVVRVSKARSAFYFAAASSLCPRQMEIGLFPFFPWYPRNLKRKIMLWAASKRPGLVGYTETPAINWFNPWETRRTLVGLGFDRVFDRWDLVDLASYSLHKKTILRVVRRNWCTKLVGDVVVPMCAYLAVRDGDASPAGGSHAALGDLSRVRAVAPADDLRSM